MVEGNAVKGYVCPRCRLLISASSEMVGREVACPGCNSPIRVPVLGDAIVPVDFNVSLHAAPVQAYHTIFTDKWRNDLPKELLEVQAKGLPWAMLVPGFVLGSGLLISLLDLLISTNISPAVRARTELAATMASSEQTSPAHEVPTIADAEALLAQLSQVKSLGEIEPYLRKVPQLQVKLANYYKTEEVSFGSPVNIFEAGEELNKSGFYRFNILLGDGVRKAVVLFKGSNANWVMDWETYVGYCDVAWDELPKIQPKQPCLVRAFRVQNEYYNQGFSSDVWQSFELIYPDSETVLIGYARKNDAVMHRLLPIGNRMGAMAVTLKVHYPKDVRDSKLVIIDEVIAGGWIVTKTK